MARQLTTLNGRLPAAMLRDVGRDVYGRPARFRLDAAASWERMRAAGMPHHVTDTYRDLARQEAYWRNPPNAAGLAAYPGRSWHGEGLAVDARGACLTWLATYGRSHGWHRTIMPAEPWHFEYDPDTDTYLGDLMAKLDTDDYVAIADHVWGRIIGAVNGIGPASAEQFLQHATVKATAAAGQSAAAHDAAASAAGRAQTARDQIKLHREAARKGDE